ncbi:hypothetical protein [Acidovorax sp. A1169]|uniref:hypothetical protein n=1 Tax=Acidovorax sp. A1169 TaxID=3059524 RepID=UPI002737D895|nr:hypothetical protein [Acidovorax sp. A1169]MDP4078859.1 hypothetical protein [Acidovorax sp. A1169]
MHNHLGTIKVNGLSPDMLLVVNRTEIAPVCLVGKLRLERGAQIRHRINPGNESPKVAVAALRDVGRALE